MCLHGEFDYPDYWFYVSYYSFIWLIDSLLDVTFLDWFCLFVFVLKTAVVQLNNEKIDGRRGMRLYGEFVRPCWVPFVFCTFCMCSVCCIIVVNISKCSIRFHWLTYCLTIPFLIGFAFLFLCLQLQWCNWTTNNWCRSLHGEWWVCLSLLSTIGFVYFVCALFVV